jgi:hypothetical protein
MSEEDGTGEDIQTLIQKGVEEALKPIKEKLDKAYESKATLEGELNTLKKKNQERELERLENEGKAKEALELRLKEEREEREKERAQEKLEKENLLKKNDELTRDAVLRGFLSGYSFKNEKSAKLAHQDIVQQLVQVDGEWKHESGATMEAFVKSFAGAEENEFMFKAELSNGANLPPIKKTSGDGAPNSLFKMTQKQVLDGIRKGTLKR